MHCAAPRIPTKGLEFREPTAKCKEEVLNEMVSGYAQRSGAKAGTESGECLWEEPGHRPGRWPAKHLPLWEYGSGLQLWDSGWRKGGPEARVQRQPGRQHRGGIPKRRR